jgi:periplasmic glucans biosynthesis protein
MQRHRRQLLQCAPALLAAGLPWSALLAHAAAAAAAQPLGKPQPFDFDWLIRRAHDVAGLPYRPPKTTLPPPIASLDWDRWQSIQFRPEKSLWADAKLRFQARFFHLGFTIKTPVHLYEVANGKAQELAYDGAMFDYGKSGVHAGALPKDLGFAGFRLLFDNDWVRDVAAFQGASYFRAVGGEKQFGQSARGLAIDTGMAKPEEFPNFIAYWLERPQPGAASVNVYGLLDSPSVAGAYRFVLAPGDDFLMDIDAVLYPRQPIERIGIAPLTAMYQVGENDHRMANDWRPEIHDVDGLQLWTGSGEWIWRPLVNPSSIKVNSYFDQDPRGFGLLQRDRNFDHYQDDGVFYDRRPSVWVEPKGKWGKGAVMLVELPTPDETFDNIVAFWHPEEQAKAGDELRFGYKLYWGEKMPNTPPLATVVATRDGVGGIVGLPRPYYSYRFVVDFAGGELAGLDEHAAVEPVIEASRGTIELTSARTLAEISGRRAIFDLKPSDDSTEPINLRLYLRLGDRTLSETWFYQWVPPPVAERKFQ